MTSTSDHTRLRQEEEELGAFVLELLRDWQVWVTRRVEAVSFQDDLTVLRHVSVDFTIPPDISSPYRTAEGTPILYVPLTLLHKRKMTRFSLRDENDTALPLLAGRDNGAVAMATLVALARALAYQADENPDKPMSEWVLDKLWQITHIETPRESLAAAAQLLDISAPSSDPETRGWQEIMANDEVFVELAGDLARNFLVIAPVPMRAGDRRIVKLSYEYNLRRPPSVFWARVKHRLRRGPLHRPTSFDDIEERFSKLPDLQPKDQLYRALGIWPKTLYLPAPAFGQTHSYHAEVEAPEGLKITRLKLIAYEPDAKESKVVDYEDRNLQRAHVFAHAKRQRYSGLIIANFRPRAGTVIRASFTACLVTGLLLIVAALYRNNVSKDVSPVVGLLLIVPGGLAAYVVRPQEAPFTSSVVNLPRLLAVLSSGAAIVGALVLVLGRHWEEQQDGTFAVAGLWCGTGITLAALGATCLFLAFCLWSALRQIFAPPEQRKKPVGRIAPHGQTPADQIQGSVR